MKAEICYKDFDHKESLKLRPFLLIAQHFAERWGKKIILDAPHRQSINPKGSIKVESPVYIHFFSSPPLEAARMRVATTVFSIALPQDGITEKREGVDFITYDGDGLGLGFSWGGGYGCVTSPEGITVARVMNMSDIYILFDLAHQPWPGVKLIFWEILEAVSKLIMRGKDGAKDESGEEISRARSFSNLREAMLGKRQEFFRNFRKASVFLLGREELYARKNLEEYTALMIGDEEKLSRIRLNIEIFNNLLEGLSASGGGEESELRQQFETIHKLKGVLGLEIRGNELLIFTRPIEHFCDIGKHVLPQYVIKVEPADFFIQKDKAVKFAVWEEGWQGNFSHPGFTDRDFNNRCLGGLASSMQKAVGDFNFLATVNLALIYLDSDNRSPTRTNDRPAKKYEAKTFYKSNEAREGACRAYIALVRKYQGKRRIEIFKDELALLTKEEKAKTASWNLHRKQAACFSMANRFIQDFIGEIPLEEEFNKLMSMADLVFAEIRPDFMELVFGPAKVRRERGEVKNFQTTLRIAVDIKSRAVLVTNPDNQNEDAFYYDRAVSDGLRKRLGNEAFVGREIGRGRCGSAVDMLYKHLRGAGKVGNEKGEPRVFSGKEIARFLRRINLTENG